MSGLSKIFALVGASTLLFVPLVAAHAQVMSPYGYSNSYYQTYPTTSYPTTNSDQYYDNYNSSYYPNTNYNTYPSSSYYNNGYYPYSYPSPTCTLSITSPSSYNSYGYGNSAVTGTVSWTTQNASSVYLSNVGQVNMSGSVSVSMYPGETFTLEMTGPGGNGTCQNEYYPAQPAYQYPVYNQQPYYSTPTYYPTYPVSYVPPTTTYVIPIINRPIYNPITTIRNWWSKAMHW